MQYQILKSRDNIFISKTIKNIETKPIKESDILKDPL